MWEDSLLSQENRDAFRKDILDALPSFYNPYLHLGITSLFGVATIGGALFLIHDLRWWEWTGVPLFYLFFNMSEWNIHKYMLHRRSRIAPVLYDRHTPVHHRIYLTDDMEIRTTREFALVLIPAYGIVLVFAATIPLTLLLWFLGLGNLAGLFVIVAMAYVLSYEWLHLAFHLPRGSWVGRRRLIRKLARFHAIHHDPRLMQRWNFNVTVPLWDWVQGTLLSRREEAPGGRSPSV
ncbi:MAG: fatty acid hydroxylase [Deltaproteobacteria bacterium]|nr:MAG: fatty acid hydroxylase [Deltaproteobacteria bacterium]